MDDKMISVNADIDVLISELVDRKGIKPLGEGSLTMIKKDIRAALMESIDTAILTAIPEDKLEEFTGIVSEANAEKIENFYKEHIPNMNMIVEKTITDFANLYLSN